MRIIYLLVLILFLISNILFAQPVNKQGPVENIVADGLSNYITKTGKSQTYTIFIWANTVASPNDTQFDGATFNIKYRCIGKNNSTDKTPWDIMPGTSASYSVTDTAGDGVISVGPVEFGHCQTCLDVSSSDTGTILNFNILGAAHEEK